ncbi:hypothetical protein [Paraburkholderia phosphatilytica]|uniref:hypothetical protein n=1 Tax=Paraburkholderia phosphatilytica TaxID=2282883 RepID=UPI000E4830CA|nr:hypothetical protein [Paraburkholderia phosphatilytica]
MAAMAPPEHAQTGNGAASPELAAARSDLEENNLTGAHAALNRALNAGASGNEALALREDLRSREQARDAALNTARACLERHAYKCAWHNAGDAASMDAGSTEATAIEQRARTDWSESQAAGQGSDNDQ